MKKILLTGGSGFIGKNILEELSKSYKITSLIRKKKKITIHKNINFLYFKDLNYLDQILKKKKFDIIIHCATHYKKIHNENDMKKMIDANIYLGNIILDNYKNIKFTKFINFTTVWENFDGLKNNPPNLYSTYKLSFSNIIKFYQKQLPKVNFYNLYLSETFGLNDKRKKILSTIKKNYKKNSPTAIVSKNLSINIINIKDIVLAINIVLTKKIKKGSYALVNNKQTSVHKLISEFNKFNKKKIKFIWMSTKIIKEKMFKYKKIPGWYPQNSSIKDLINYIANR
jgi:nucleoside-diphosphate-sugar epimerase